MAWPDRGDDVGVAGAALVDPAVGSLVVVVDELDQECTELAFVPDDGAVEQFVTQRVHPSGGGEAAVPGQKRVGRDDEPVTDPPGDHTGEPGESATVDITELGTCRGSWRDRGLVTERNDLGLEHAARIAAGDHQLDDGDEQPVHESAKTGAGWSSRAGSHERARLRPATPRGTHGRADRVFGTNSQQVGAPPKARMARSRQPTTVGNVRSHVGITTRNRDHPNHAPNRFVARPLIIGP